MALGYDDTANYPLPATLTRSPTQADIQKRQDAASAIPSVLPTAGGPWAGAMSIPGLHFGGPYGVTTTPTAAQQAAQNAAKKLSINTAADVGDQSGASGYARSVPIGVVPTPMEGGITKYVGPNGATTYTNKGPQGYQELQKMNAPLPSALSWLRTVPSFGQGTTGRGVAPAGGGVGGAQWWNDPNHPLIAASIRKHAAANLTAQAYMQHGLGQLQLQREAQYPKTVLDLAEASLANEPNALAALQKARQGAYPYAPINTPTGLGVAQTDPRTGAPMNYFGMGGEIASYPPPPYPLFQPRPIK